MAIAKKTLIISCTQTKLGYPNSVIEWAKLEGYIKKDKESNGMHSKASLTH